jgi:S1-C subfamily serine protease
MIKLRFHSCTVFSLLLAVLAAGPGVLWAGATGDRPDEEQVVRVYRDVVPATVFLSSSYTTGNGRNSSIGSGFIVDEAGTILTNAHVVEGAHTVMARLYDGQRVRAEVLGIDSYSDVAALRLTGVKGKVPFVRLGTSDALRIGQRALVIGNPFGLGFGLSTGILSGLNRLPPGLAFSEPRVPLIQTTAPINPGDSGGPLVNSEGRVIGITTAMLMGTQNIGFAVPIDLVKEVLGELKASGKVSRPWLGVGGKFVTEEIRELFVLPLADGLLVGEVYPGGPAAEGGLQAGTVDVTVAGEPWMMGGDLIVSLQGRSLRTMEDFISAFKDLKVGETVSVEFIRDRMRRRTSLVVTERPQGLSHITSMPIGNAGRPSQKEAPAPSSRTP